MSRYYFPHLQETPVSRMSVVTWASRYGALDKAHITQAGTHLNQVRSDPECRFMFALNPLCLEACALPVSFSSIELQLRLEHPYSRIAFAS